VQPTGVDFVSYSVADLDRAVAFYRDTLGLPLRGYHPMAGFTRFPWVEFDVGETTIALVGTAGAPPAEVDLTSPWPEHRWAAERPASLEPPRGPAGQHGGAMVALAVPDLRATVEELRAEGVPVVMEPTQSPVCWLAMIADPDGNRLWLHQSTRRPATANPPPAPDR
jgi:predicted enzyme related to lactoylglutathione lyase